MSGNDVDQLRRRHAELQAKYADLCRKHEALVSTRLERVRERIDVVELATAALLHAPFAAALVGPEGVRARDGKWMRLAFRDPGPWSELREDGTPSDAQHGTLDALAIAVAQRVPPREAARLRVESAATGRVLDLRVAGAGDRPAAAVAIAVDVTERARAERELDQLRQATAAQERVRELGLLAAGVAHDLSNAVQGVKLRVELLQHEAAPGPYAAQLEVLARLTADAGDRLRRLRELAVGGAPGALGHVALGDAVLDAAEIARPHVERPSRDRKRPVLIQLDVPALLPRVVADPAELRHVLLNLILNARDAMPEGGIVRVRAMHGGAWGIVTVSDEGTGFADEQLQRAFEPFFTTKGASGSGLGLSGAAEYARRVGGFITVENRPAGGARVRLTFPAHRAPIEERGAVDAAAPGSA